MIEIVLILYVYCVAVVPYTEHQKVSVVDDLKQLEAAKFQSDPAVEAQQNSPSGDTAGRNQVLRESASIPKVATPYGSRVYNQIWSILMRIWLL